MLTATEAAARAGHDVGPSPQRPAAPEPAVTGHPREGAGATQAALRRLGVISPDLPQLTADIDRASEQLIIEAASRPHQPASGYQHEPQKQNTDHQPPVRRLSRFPRRGDSGVPLWLGQILSYLAGQPA